MAKFYRYKEVNFILQNLYIDGWYYDDKFISDEDVDIINKLNPKMLEIPLNIYDPKKLKGSFFIKLCQYYSIILKNIKIIDVLLSY